MAKKKKADDGENAGGAKKKKKIMTAVGILLLAGGGYKFVLAPEPAVEPAAAAAVELEPEEGEVLELPEVVINLSNPEIRYARVGVALVLEKGTAAKDFEAESAIAKDVILSYLSKLSYEQLREPATKEQAKAELAALIREAYGDAKVVRVLFTVLVMQ